MNIEALYEVFAVSQSFQSCRTDAVRARRAFFASEWAHGAAGCGCRGRGHAAGVRRRRHAAARRARAARGLPGMVRQLRAPGVFDGLRACPGGDGAAPAAGWRLSPGKAHADARRAQRSAGVYRAERDGAAPRGLSARAVSALICKRSAGHASAWGWADRQHAHRLDGVQPVGGRAGADARGAAAGRYAHLRARALRRADSGVSAGYGARAVAARLRRGGAGHALPGGGRPAP